MVMDSKVIQPINCIIQYDNNRVNICVNQKIIHSDMTHINMYDNMKDRLVNFGTDIIINHLKGLYQVQIEVIMTFIIMDINRHPTSWTSTIIMDNCPIEDSIHNLLYHLLIQ